MSAISPSSPSSPFAASAMLRGRARTFRRAGSGLMFWGCAACTMGVIAILILVVAYLAMLGVPGLTWELFTRAPTGDPAAPGGLRNGITGTLVLLAMASAVGVPLGVFTGVYLSEFSREKLLVAPTRFIADVLAGVPSIVVGILGYELLVVPLQTYNGWAGAFALAFIMVPIVARTTEEMLRVVPDSFRQGSMALGATNAQTILRVVIPSASGSLVTGVMLAMARVAGETAPLLFTALGSRLLSLDPSQPFPSLTLQIYEYVTGPYEKQKQVGWAGILVLIGLLLVLNLSIRLATARAAKTKH